MDSCLARGRPLISSLGVESDLPSVECPEPVEGLWFVYILQCQNGLLYVGIAKDVGNRFKQHLIGKGARQTMINKPLRIVYIEGPMQEVQATERERQLKKWSKQKKIALAKGNFVELRGLARSRDDACN